jgi:hypothetical protein
LVHKDLLRRLALLCSLSAIAIGASGGAHAGQLQASAFQTYHPTQASSIVPGAFALFVVPVSGILPTQINEGLAEVGKKTASFDLLALSQLQSNLLTDIEPVVIGPGGKLYLTDGPTFYRLGKLDLRQQSERFRQRHRQLLEPDDQPVLPDHAVAEPVAAAQRWRAADGQYGDRRTAPDQPHGSDQRSLSRGSNTAS